MPTYQDQMRQIERRRKIAEALMQQGGQPQQAQSSGRFLVGPTTTSTLAGLASIVGGGLLSRRADQDEKAARETEQQRIAQAMERMTGGDPAAADPRQQAAREILGGLPVETQQQTLGQQALKTLFPPEKKQTSPFGKIDPKDYTPESIAAFQKSGDPSVLVPRTKYEVSGGEVYDPYAVKPGQKVGTPSAGTTVNVNTEKNLYGTMADAQGKANVDLYAQATKAPELLNRARRVKELVGPESQAITGAGADWMLSAAKIANQLGFNTGDAAADTEMLARELGGATLDVIKSSGLGAGSGFSNADRDFLEKVAGGQITMQADTLARLADLNERAAMATIQKWNATASRLDPQQLRTLGMSPIEMPAGTPAPAARPKLEQRSDGTWLYTP